MKYIKPSGHRRVPFKKENKRFKYLKIAVILIVLAVLAYFFYKITLINTESVQVNGINSQHIEDIKNDIVAQTGNRPAFTINELQMVELMYQKHPTLKLNNMDYNFPNKLVLDVSKRDQKYSIQASNGVFITDSEGMVLGALTESTESIDLNVIYDKSLEVGKKIEDTAVQAGLIYSELNQTVKIENDQIHIDIDNGGKIILPKNSAVSKVNDFFNMLQKLIQKYTIDNRQIEFIDLRFSKPVIKYKE